MLTDRTETIRASVSDVQFTLLLTVALVVMVIFLFLRKFWATLIPSVALPLSIIGTFGVMKLLGFSLDNLSLMALTIATGFVVDDAIVMIENIVRYIEVGEPPLEAALKGARQIGFTIISLTISLVAVFIPLLFMSGHRRPAVPRVRGHAGDRDRRLGGRVADADADDVRAPAQAGSASEKHGRFYRVTGARLRADARAATTAACGWVLRHQVDAVVALATLVATLLLYVRRAEGLPPAAGHRPDHRRHRCGADDLLPGDGRLSSAVADVVREDPDVQAWPRSSARARSTPR